MKHHVSKEVLDSRPDRCDLCGGYNGGKPMHLDHDHKCTYVIKVLNKKTGRMVIDKKHPSKVACPMCHRGWLCYSCNRFVLGRLTLEKALALVEYLSKQINRTSKNEGVQDDLRRY